MNISRLCYQEGTSIPIVDIRTPIHFVFGIAIGLLAWIIHFEVITIIFAVSISILELIFHLLLCGKEKQAVLLGWNGIMDLIVANIGFLLIFYLL